MERTDITENFTIEADPFFAQDLRQMAKAVNYRQWQFKLVSPYLSRKVLEVGGGIGNFTLDLARVADSVVSVEPNNYCYAQLVEKTRGMPNVKIYNITAEALDRFMGADYQADTVVCMNVLEHLENDELAVNTFSKRLRPGGLLVLLIPAGPWLFGEIDRRLGHYRRYSKRQRARIDAPDPGLKIAEVCAISISSAFGAGGGMCAWPGAKPKATPKSIFSTTTSCPGNHAWRRSSPHPLANPCWWWRARNHRHPRDWPAPVLI